MGIPENILYAFENGRREERISAQMQLSELQGEVRVRMRELLVNAINQRYRPESFIDSREKGDISSIRPWLWNALARISDDEPETIAFLKSCLVDPKVSPEEDCWSRYWLLEGLLLAKSKRLCELAEAATKNPQEDPLVDQLARLIVANENDKTHEYASSVVEALEDSNLQWAALRALRIIPLHGSESSICDSICTIIAKGGHRDETYDAIVSLGCMQATDRNAGDAALALDRFVRRFNRFPSHNTMRQEALAALGYLKAENAVSTLLSELTDENPSIMRTAARSLECILGTENATEQIFRRALKDANPDIESLARAMRWLNRTRVVQQIERLMTASSLKEQELGRQLLSEIGGLEAFDKLRARRVASEEYTQLMKHSEERVGSLFKETITEARIGFYVMLVMDGLQFLVGLILIVIAIHLVLTSDDSIQDFIKIFAAGAGGAATMIYTTMLSRSRKLVHQNVTNRMKLNTIFHAFLRQIQQIDQSYTRNLLEADSFDSAQTGQYTNLVDQVMKQALNRLQRLNVLERELFLPEKVLTTTGQNPVNTEQNPPSDEHEDAVG